MQACQLAGMTAIEWIMWITVALASPPAHTAHSQEAKDARGSWIFTFYFWHWQISPLRFRAAQQLMPSHRVVLSHLLTLSH